MRSGTSRPGGRTALTRQRVHAAVRELLQSSAGAPLQMTQIAAHSGVNSATLYRRWGSVDALILDTVVDDLSERSPLEPTGDLREDLLRYAIEAQRGIAQPDGLRFLKAVAAVADTPDGEAVAREVAQRRLDDIDGLLTMDEARGLTALDIVNGIIAPITYRRLLTPRQELQHHEIERLVDTLLSAAAARTT